MNSPLRMLAALLGAFLSLCLSQGICLGEKAPGVSSINAGDNRPVAASDQTVDIPGPLRSFQRMAGISQKVFPKEVLPLLARNVFIQGYQDGKPTEFLILVERYLEQARELQVLAGSSSIIQIADCNHAGDLLRVLGYRLQPGCGQKNIFLTTANSERAFLTIDSGFPLADLEEDLRKNVPFSYAFPSSRVPVLLNESDWVGLGNVKEKGNGNLIDVLLRDQPVARLYWAFAKNDAETQIALQHSPGLRKLLPYGAVLNFYGSQLSIRSGRVLVPGGAAAEPLWKDLVGASAESSGDFILHLLAKDNGWLAVYFDALARVNPAQQAHLTEAPRLKHLYEAFRTSASNEYPARAVFRKATPLLVLFTRVQWEPNGDPHVPGSLDAWQEILAQKTSLKIVHDWGKRSRHWNSPDQLLEAMVAFSHITAEGGPLNLYLILSEIDRVRPAGKRLSAPTVRVLAGKYPQRYQWYLIFSEFPELNDQSMARFVHVADSIDGISQLPLRGNTLGIFQAELGLWQILARQGEIHKNQLNESWQSTIATFENILSPAQLLDAAHNSLGELSLVTTGRQSPSQDELIALLAGPRQTNSEGERVHAEMADRIRAVLDDQRLVSLDTLFALSDGLRQMTHGAPIGGTLVPLAEDLRGFELPQQIFTRSEKVEWAPTIYSSRHAELQIRTDLTKVLKTPASHAQLEVARGQLAPFVRDTLVGLNYAYYEPPGAQVLHNNPLFVRSHDFSGFSIMGSERPWQSPQLFGIGTPAGGGAYLIGSLTDLPYALAVTEEDFIAPENVQALIWKEVVPHLLVSATLPRWWDVSADELHAAALYQRAGEEFLAAAIENEPLQGKVLSILSERMAPRRLEQTEVTFRSGSAPRLLPADNFYLASQFRERFPHEDAASFGPANRELERLLRKSPKINPERLSKDFGAPHPTLAQNYSLELLSVKPFPASGGDDSRLFGECWDSTNLYWARLADEMGYSPVMLNRLVPELTRRMVAKIFATDLEDWEAVQRAMQETGEEFRQGKIASLQVTKDVSDH